MFSAQAVIAVLCRGEGRSLTIASGEREAWATRSLRAGMRVLAFEKTLADYVFRAMCCCVNGDEKIGSVNVSDRWDDSRFNLRV